MRVARRLEAAEAAASPPEGAAAAAVAASVPASGGLKAGEPPPIAVTGRRRRVGAVHRPAAGASGPTIAGADPAGAVYTPISEQQRHASRTP